MRFALAALLFMGSSVPALAQNYTKESNRPLLVQCIKDIEKVSKDVLSDEYVSRVHYCTNTFPVPIERPSVSPEFEGYLQAEREAREAGSNAERQLKSDYQFYRWIHAGRYPH